MDSSLPVVQLKESHALRLDPDFSPSGGSFAWALAVYPRMTAGDQINLKWQGFFDDSVEEVPYIHTKTVTSVDFGHPLVWPSLPLTLAI